MVWTRKTARPASPFCNAFFDLGHAHPVVSGGRSPHSYLGRLLRSATVGIVRFSRRTYTFSSLAPRENALGVGVAATNRPAERGAMRFHLIDRVDGWEPGKTLRAAKVLALGEEYLADHFPRFPVMPGVLMLQACVEAASWLWRATSDFAHPVIVLRSVQSVKYGTFMQPGRRMDVSVELTRADAAAGTATFKSKGCNDTGEQTVAAQFTLHGYGLADRGPAGVAAAETLLANLKAHWALLTGQLRRPG